MNWSTGCSATPWVWSWCICKQRQQRGYTAQCQDVWSGFNFERSFSLSSCLSVYVSHALFAALYCLCVCLDGFVSNMCWMCRWLPWSIATPMRTMQKKQNYYIISLRAIIKAIFIHTRDKWKDEGTKSWPDYHRYQVITFLRGLLFSSEAQICKLILPF